MATSQDPAAFSPADLDVTRIEGRLGKRSSLPDDSFLNW